MIWKKENSITYVPKKLDHGPKFLVERQMMNDRYFWEKDINFSLASTASVYYASVVHKRSFNCVQLKNIEFRHFKNVGCVRDCSRNQVFW